MDKITQMYALSITREKNDYQIWQTLLCIEHTVLTVMTQFITSTS